MIKERFRFGTSMYRGGTRARGAGRGGLLPAEYAVLLADGRPAPALPGERPRMRDLLEAYRWLQTARTEAIEAEDPARAAGLYIGVRRRVAQPWQRHGQVLCVPEREPGAPKNPLPLIYRGPAPVPRRLARLRAASLLAPLLAREGLDGATAASLLPHHEGFFPSLEVGVARLVDARFTGRARGVMRCLDLPALLDDLITGATIWTLRDAGDERWPAGIHLFAAPSPRPKSRQLVASLRARARSRGSISHDPPR